MPTDLLEKPRLPRSVVRHRRVMPDAVNTQARTPRASRAKRHHEPHTTGGPPSVAEAPTPARGTWLIHLILGILIAMALLWVGQLIWGWTSTTLDDLRYGRPRTTNVDRFVGHEVNRIPSHFTALNLDGQIYLIEIPGGSPKTSRLLVGPHLYGPGADLAPVTLIFVGDAHKPDLLVVVSNIQVRFHNTGSTYVAAEQS
jgi:hypothetical protein